MNARRVAVNDRGAVVGQDHWRAKLTDHEVDLLLQLRAEGWSYGRLAAKFEISKTHAFSIVNGDKRGQSVAGSRIVRLPRKARRTVPA